MDRPPQGFMGPLTILIVVIAVVLGSAFVAMNLSRQAPEEVAGRTPPTGQTAPSDSSTAQDPQRSGEQGRAVPGLPKQ
jgi:hypothetical protein